MAPAEKKAAAKKAPAKKKAAAKKAAAKKKAPGKKAAAKKAPATSAATATRATPAPTGASGPRTAGAAPAQQQTVTVTSWNPSSGRGTVQVGEVNVPFDVARAQVLNKGYVDLYVGQQVGVVVHEDGSDVEALEAL